MEHLDLVNDMYTKVNLNFNKDINSENNILVDSSSKKVKKSFENRRFNNDLDFLFDDENIDDKLLHKISVENKKTKLKNKLKQKINKKTNNYYSYFILFILFMLLNSYYIINLFNSYKLSYYLSLSIRGIMLIALYHYIINIEKN